MQRPHIQDLGNPCAMRAGIYISKGFMGSTAYNMYMYILMACIMV